MIQNDLLANLTEPQRQAASHMDGPMLVLAGPGSGKTRVITHRVAYMIQQGVNPANILAITFTNKAAKEMAERLHTLRIPRGSTICTFHSLAARLLREFADRAELTPDFSIYDTADQKALMREALKQCEVDSQNFPPARLLNRISSYKNNIQTPEEVTIGQFDLLGKITKKVYAKYQELLVANSAVDFDDLLMKLALLLRDDPQLRHELNCRYKYVMIDEYQDTNQCQYQIARGLALDHGNLFVTGDPDQSIYGWRGADIANILAFEEDYPDATLVRLEENFRSTPQVLELADELIKKNQQRKHKQLFTSRPSGPPCELVQYDTEHTEAAGMAEWLNQMHNRGIEYRDMAVFYRVNSMSRVLEESLRKAKIPYQIVRGVEFFQRKEIKDMLAYLRLLANPSDQVAIKRVINTPTRGIGNTTVERLFNYSDETGINLWQVISDPEQVSTLNNAAKTKVAKFAAMVNDLREYAENATIEQIMKQTYEKSTLAENHVETKDEEAMENVKELINSAIIYDSEMAEAMEETTDEIIEPPSLTGYLQQIALISDTDSYDENSGAVSLMTLHAAKGLEFPVVRIIGLEEGIIPHSRNLDDGDMLEEERRLLFVGITRAQENLVMSYARQRMVQGTTKPGILSQFMRDMTGLIVHNDSIEDDFDEDPMDQDREYYDDDYDQTPDVIANGFFRGQLVRHPKWGMGKIMDISGSGDKTKVVVQFASGPRKTLFLQYANLERID